MFRVLSLNIANYNDHKNWEIRSQLIINQIIEVQPDFIAFQEVRFDKDEPTTHVSHQNAAEQIVYQLRQKGFYQKAKIFTNPAMYYPSKNENQYYWEGLAILSKYPIEENGVKYLPLSEESQDRNKRITQMVKVVIDNKEIFIFNTHFSFDENEVNNNIKDTLKYMNYFGKNPKILIGDFNIYPEHNGINMLIEAGYTDAWFKLKPFYSGYSYPSFNPIKRIDYCFVNEPLSKCLKNIKMVGTNPNEDGIFPSDHFGICIDFDLSQL